MTAETPASPRSSRARWIAVAIAALLACASIAVTIAARGPAIDRALVEQAEGAYTDGIARSKDDPARARAKFVESAALLERALAAGETAALRYNRANALLRAGELGEAIVEYRRAQILAPSDARIEQNLAEARAKVARAVTPPAPGPLERAGRAWGFVAERTRWAAALACLWTATILLAARGRRALPLALVAAGCGLTLASTVAVDVMRRSDVRVAAVKDPSIIRKGNGEGFDPVLAEPLPAGTELIRRESRPGWTAVDLADGTTGWLPTSALAD